MTTENQNVARGIGVLLALDTYQGMSDEEIESIITYKCNMAYAKGNSDAVSSQAMVNLMDSKRKSDAMFARIANVIQSNVNQSDGGASQ